MELVDFSDVLSETAQLCGQDRENIPDHFFRLARDCANMRLKIAWTSERWTELTRFLEVTPVSGDAITVDYPADCGDVLNVWNSNPRENDNAIPVDYFLSSDGTTRMIVLNNNTEVVLEYRIKLPKLRGDAWQQDSAYSVGRQVYHEFEDGTGNFYTAIAATNPGETPENTPTKWERIKVPLIFGQYLSRGIYADYLRSNGEPIEARGADKDAEAMLVLEADNQFRQQSQIKRLQVEQYR
jgi:hypothetical protein